MGPRAGVDVRRRGDGGSAELLWEVDGKRYQGWLGAGRSKAGTET